MAWARAILAASVMAFLLSGCSQPGSGISTTSTTSTGATQTAHIGDVVGFFTIERINADSVDGTYRYPYPVGHEEGEPKTIRVGDEVGAACEGKTYVLSAIDAAGQSVTFTEKFYPESPGGCPICLSGDTMIETPAGPVNVKELRVGDTVWALEDGRREALPIEKVGRTPAVAHTVVHLVLADGRELTASPGHSLADGRTLGELRAGDAVDGSAVHAARLVPYGDGYTYDIKAGDGYWANGILVASTLA